MKARLAQAERQIAARGAEIDACLDTCPKRRRTVQILTSIPGIGRITARTILAECPEIGTLRHKQIAALAGLAPMTRQSGTWQGKARIEGAGGDTCARPADLEIPHVRGDQDRFPFLSNMRVMPALVATKKTPGPSAQYDRMREAGKPHKPALTADAKAHPAREHPHQGRQAMPPKTRLTPTDT